eukprot:scpid101337/ scgid30546/ 
MASRIDLRARRSQRATAPLGFLVLLLLMTRLSTSAVVDSQMPVASSSRDCGLVNTEANALLYVSSKAKSQFQCTYSRSDRVKKCTAGFIEARCPTEGPCENFPAHCSNVSTSLGKFTPLIYHQWNSSDSVWMILALRHNASKLFLSQEKREGGPASLVLRSMGKINTTEPISRATQDTMLFLAKGSSPITLFQLYRLCTKPLPLEISRGRRKPMYVFLDLSLSTSSKHSSVS